MFRSFLTSVLLILLWTVPVSARHGIYESADGLYYAIGYIQDIRRNTIEIDDEQTNQKRSFVYLHDTDAFQKGERVRIYYDWRTRLIHDIRKMSKVTYEPHNQNMGYLLKNQ